MRSNVFRIFSPLAIAAVLSTACVVPPAPKPVPIVPPDAPANMVWLVDAVACADAGAVPFACQTPIGGATIQLHGPDGYVTKTADGAGYAVFTLPANFPDSDVIIDAPGYLTARQHIDVAGTHDSAKHNIVTLRSAHVDPASFSDAQIRNVKTDLAGVYISELAPQCPVDPQTGIHCQADNGITPRGITVGILFTANYRIYTDAQRKIIRDVFTGKRPDARGLIHHYTHFPISLFCSGAPDYHGVYPPCASSARVGLNDALHELLDDGLIPIGFAMQDDEPDDLTTPLSIAGVVDPSLVPLVTPYWEHYNVDCAMVKVRALFPHARLYYHNPVDTDAGYPDACYAHNSEAEYGALGSGAGWWRHARDAYGLIGALVQNGEGTVQDVINRLADFTARFVAGFHGWATGIDTVWFEDTNSVYNNFWGGGDETALIQRADAVLQSTPFCVDGFCGPLAGYGSGGSR